MDERQTEENGHCLRRFHSTLWSGSDYRGFVTVLEQGLAGFPRDSFDRMAPMFGVGLLTRGRAQRTTTLGAYQLSEGNGFVAIPESIASFRIDRSMPYGDWLALCDGDTYRTLCALEVVPDGEHWHARRPAVAQAAYRRLAEDLRRIGRYDRPEGVMRFARFLRELQTIDAGPAPMVASDHLDHAAQLLAEHCSSSLRIEAVLADIAVPYDRLRKAFTAAHGISPAQYRIRERIGHACRLLAQHHSIPEVAEALGYADQFQFSKQFRKVMGMPPGRYRETS